MILIEVTRARIMASFWWVCCVSVFCSYSCEVINFGLFIISTIFYLQIDIFRYYFGDFKKLDLEQSGISLISLYLSLDHGFILKMLQNSAFLKISVSTFFINVD